MIELLPWLGLVVLLIFTVTMASRLSGRRQDILPPPYDDDRDSITKFKKLMDVRDE